ncbi:MAG: hypothetical protein K0Q73_6932 [Paenibacillus sp.]|nr:hypothetical protein [Paenibacillus sp.]
MKMKSYFVIFLDVNGNTKKIQVLDPGKYFSLKVGEFGLLLYRGNYFRSFEESKTI